MAMSRRRVELDEEVVECLHERVVAHLVRAPPSERIRHRHCMCPLGRGELPATGADRTQEEMLLAVRDQRNPEETEVLRRRRVSKDRVVIAVRARDGNGTAVVRWPSATPTENNHVCSSATESPSAGCSGGAIDQGTLRVVLLPRAAIQSVPAHNSLLRALRRGGDVPPRCHTPLSHFPSSLSAEAAP